MASNWRIIAENSGDRPSLRHLVLAGHSRAYDILTPLAKEFVSGVPATTRGALAKLVRVLALDTTYGTRHAEMLMKWADKLGAVKFLLVLSSHGYDPEKNDCRFRKNDPPIKYWDCAAQGVQLPANLEVKKVSAKHCRLPNDCVKIALTSASKKQDPESFDSEGSGTPGTPVLFLAKVKISGLPEIILSWGSSGHYEGFFATPIHLRDDQTGYAQSTRKTIELSGRIQIEESGVRRDYDGKKDGKDWPLGGIEGIAPVKIVKADGPIISTASISKVRRDGSFSFTTAVIVDGFTRSLTIYPKLDLKHAKIIAATVEVELLDLEGFLALVDPREKARPASQTHPEFLASVRKIYQGGPKDPLSGAFDMVLYRHRAVKPLAAPGTALDQRFKLYKDWLFDPHSVAGWAMVGLTSCMPIKDWSSYGGIHLVPPNLEKVSFEKNLNPQTSPRRHVNHLVAGNDVDPVPPRGVDHVIAGEAAEGRQQGAVFAEVKAGQGFPLAARAPNADGRVHVSRDRVPGQNGFWLVLVGKEEREGVVLRADAIQSERGRRCTGLQVVISGDERQSDIAPAPAPGVDGGMQAGVRVDAAVHQIAEHQQFIRAKALHQRRQAAEVLGGGAAGHRDAALPKHPGLAEVGIGHDQHARLPPENRPLRQQQESLSDHLDFHGCTHQTLCFHLLNPGLFRSGFQLHLHAPHSVGELFGADAGSQAVDQDRKGQRGRMRGFDQAQAGGRHLLQAV